VRPAGEYVTDGRRVRELERPDMVHLLHIESKTAMQMKCYTLHIREELAETADSVTCLECLATTV
jgi:hypothetical protein